MKKNIMGVLFILLLAISCNEQASSGEEMERTDTVASRDTAETSSYNFEYDPALEPLTVGAKFSKLLTDTLGVKMYEFTIKPGDSAALHKHPDHLVYVLQGGKGLISFNGGEPQEMELQTGMGFMSGSLTDAGKNIGKTTIKLLVIDIYRPRSNDK